MPGLRERIEKQIHHEEKCRDKAHRRAARHQAEGLAIKAENTLGTANRHQARAEVLRRVLREDS